VRGKRTENVIVIVIAREGKWKWKDYHS